MASIFVNPVAPRSLEVDYRSPPIRQSIITSGLASAGNFPRFVQPWSPRRLDPTYISPQFADVARSAARSLTVYCDAFDTTGITVSVSEGLFQGGTQAEVDALALAYLQAVADAALLENCSDTIFEQYDGPFAGIRYLTQSVEGYTRVCYGFSFTGMDHDHNAGMFPLPNGSTTGGLRGSTWSGAATLDPLTSTYSGEISATVMEAGGLPGGVNFVVSARPAFTVTGVDFDQMLTNLIFDGFTFAARSFSEGVKLDGRLVKKWFSETPGPTSGGFFAGGAMGAIWSDGWTLTVTYSNLVTVDQAGATIARTGDPARTQHVTGYDPVTFTYSGNKSRIRQTVVVPAGKTRMFGTFKYLVTPDNGDAAYFYYDSQDYAVSAGPFNAMAWFPWIVDATVYLVSTAFSFSPTYFLGFVGTPNKDVVVLPDNSNWPEEVSYAMPTPNAEVWDEFDDYGGVIGEGSSEPIFSLFTGYGWEAAGKLVSVDPLDVYENFEAYVDGNIIRLTQGVGWADAGRFYGSEADYSFAQDDFESYSPGSITSLSVFGDFWVSNGVFLLVDYSSAQDDFESYPDGPITSLNVAGTYWVSNGMFV